MWIDGSLRFLQPTPDLRELWILLEIERDKGVTQNKLAQVVGVVPAMVNGYIKKLAQEGCILCAGENRRKMTYHITEKGVKRRAELLAEYNVEAIKLYKRTKESFAERLCQYYNDGMRRIILYGAGETAEVAFNAARAIGFEVVGVVDGDPRKHGEEFAGRTIMDPIVIESMKPDGVIVASFRYQAEIYDKVAGLEAKGIKVRTLWGEVA
ncbi:MAG: winged helix-turn-helix transcriptional regulator [bacterium]